MKDLFKLIIGLAIVLPALWLLLFYPLWVLLVVVAISVLAIWVVVFVLILYAAHTVGESVFDGLGKLTGLLPKIPGDKE